MKRPFDIGTVMRCVRRAVRPFPKAALFELFEEGLSSPFEQLAACIISVRTLDEVTLPTARHLLVHAFIMLRDGIDYEEFKVRGAGRRSAARTIHRPQVPDHLIERPASE